MKHAIVLIVILLLWKEISLITSGFVTKNDLGSLDGLSVTTYSCDVDSPTTTECLISCSVDIPLNDNTSYQLNNCTWKYYSDASVSTNPNVIIFDGVSYNDSGTSYVMNLNLSTYNAGQYVCFFNITENGSKTGCINGSSIIINPDVTPVNLSGSCASSTDCLALNSVCDDDGSGSNTVCQCPADFNIQYSSANDTPACLAPADVGGDCNTNKQCTSTKSTEDYKCTDWICTCEGTKEPVAEEGGAIMCVETVYLMDNCNYDEECLLAASSSYCNPTGQCDCIGGMSMMNMDSYPDASKYYCNVPNAPGITTAATIGVSIGCVVSVVIMAAIVYYFVKKVD